MNTMSLLRNMDLEKDNLLSVILVIPEIPTFSIAAKAAYFKNPIFSALKSGANQKVIG